LRRQYNDYAPGGLPRRATPAGADQSGKTGGRTEGAAANQQQEVEELRANTLGASLQHRAFRGEL